MSWTSGDFLTLNSSVAEGSNTNYWDTPPTSSVFEVNSHNSVNNTNGMLAYCFHSVEGYSKVGSYEGNDNADGTFVDTGFRPAWIMLKKTTAVGEWVMTDDKRSPYNLVRDTIYANSNIVETEHTAVLDMVSNGFKLRYDDASWNDTQTYLYIAFAESPFKYANAR